MALPARKYIRLPHAAEMLNCTIEDIVHWAATDQTKIGIPYVSDGFNPPYVYDPDNVDIRLEDYYGFAFIPSGNLITAEVSGVCRFISLSLPDDRFIMFPPGSPDIEYSEECPSEFTRYGNGIPLEELFIRAEELAELIQPDSRHDSHNETHTTDRAHVSDRLAILNQAAQKFWANADRADRTTHHTNDEVVAWLVSKGYSESLADKAATIIRPEWAGTGRKPEK